MLQWNREELDGSLSAAVCLLYLFEYFTWIARAATAPGYGPYVAYDIPRTLVIIQLVVDVAIILFLVYIQLGPPSRGLSDSSNRKAGFRELTEEHFVAIALLSCLAATDLVNIVNERNYAWLELALKVAYYSLLLLLSCVQSKSTFKTMTLLPTTVFAVMIVASNVAAETERGGSSLYLATVFENMLVVECAHMFYHLPTMPPSTNKPGPEQAELQVAAFPWIQCPPARVS
jgi:hypothetical protein